MPNINVENLEIGKEYTATELASLWEYKSHHAIVKGILTERNSNTIVLFVTKEKQNGATQYEDDIVGDKLIMMGQEGHGTDNRVKNNLSNPSDRFYLFFREIHHTPFIYYGECKLKECHTRTEHPSIFTFSILNKTIESEEELYDYIATKTEFDIEGTAKIGKHIRYERDPSNRKKAIEIQGHICKICGFNFDDVYGEELAQNYIEVHHIKQLSEGTQKVEPSKDLIPVCANCHRMLHRRKRDNISVNNLRERVLKYKRKMEGEE